MTVTQEPVPDIRRLAGAVEASLIRRRKTPEGGYQIVLEIGPQDAVPAQLTDARMHDRFMLALVPLGDDDRPVDVRGKRAARDAVMRRWRDMPLYAQVATLCDDPTFRVFLRWRFQSDVPDSEIANIRVREWCEVESRVDIEPGTYAGDRWAALEQEYRGWVVWLRNGS